MIYSRFLYTEHDSPHNENGEGGYHIFSTQQLLNSPSTPKLQVGIQTFAVLWDGTVDTRVIDLVEQSIVNGAIAPVKLLHASKGTLTIVYNPELVKGRHEAFEDAWAEITSLALYDEWNAQLIKDIDVGVGLNGGRLFRAYAPGILATHQLGIAEFTPDMFLFADEWTPQAVFGPNVFDEAEGQREHMQHGFDSFDKDIPYP